MSNSWGDFLEIRQRLIGEMRTEGKTCTEIAQILSMDPGQVYLISRVESEDPPEDARQAILEHQIKVREAFDKSGG